MVIIAGRVVPRKKQLIAKIVFTIIIMTIMPVHSALSAYKALAQAANDRG